jgi:hypothetical protein
MILDHLDLIAMGEKIGEIGLFYCIDNVQSFVKKVPKLCLVHLILTDGYISSIFRILFDFVRVFLHQQFQSVLVMLLGKSWQKQ